MASMREVTISLPEAVVEAATAVARRESRTVGELLGELLTEHERAAQWRELQRYGRERAAAVGVLTEEDVVRVCREVRAERAASSLQGAGADRSE